MEQGDDLVHDLVDAPPGAVDDHRAVGHDEGRRRPGGVDEVPPAHVVGALVVPPAGPLLGGGGEEDLEGGVGEDHAADVPALDHASAVLDRPLPLAAHQLGPHVGVGGHHAHRPAHVGAADLVGDVLAVDGDPLPHVDDDGPGHRRRVLVAPLQERERHGPVHGAGLEEVEAESVGDGLGHRRLPRPDRAVDRYDTHWHIHCAGRSSNPG